jgi:hypothetical protein
MYYLYKIPLNENKYIYIYLYYDNNYLTSDLRRLTQSAQTDLSLLSSTKKSAWRVCAAPWGGGEGSRFVRMQVGTRMGAWAEAEVVAEAETGAEGGKAEAKEAKARVESERW